MRVAQNFDRRFVAEPNDSVHSRHPVRPFGGDAWDDLGGLHGGGRRMHGRFGNGFYGLSGARSTGRHTLGQWRLLVAGAEGLNATWWIDGVEETALENLTEIPTQPGASTIQVSVSNAYGCSATSEAWQAVAVTELKAPLERPGGVRFNVLGQWMPNTRFQQPHMLLLPR